MIRFRQDDFISIGQVINGLPRSFLDIEGARRGYWGNLKESKEAVALRNESADFRTWAQNSQPSIREILNILKKNCWSGHSHWT